MRLSFNVGRQEKVNREPTRQREFNLEESDSERGCCRILNGFPVYLRKWRKVEGKSFFGSQRNEKGDISITIDFAPRLPSLFNEDDTLLPCEHHHHCHHHFYHHFHVTFWLQHKFNVLKISRKKSSEVCNKFSYNGQTEGMSKRILWTKFDPDFLCYFPDSAQKGHNSEMWNRNFKRPSNFLWNKFSLTKSLFQIIKITKK